MSTGTTSWRSLSGRATFVLATVALALGAATPAQAANDADVEVSQAIVVGGQELQTETFKAGEGFTMIVKYKCASTTTACRNAQISVPIPDSLSTGAVTPSTDVASVASVGSKRIFTMTPELAAGSTGAVTIDVAVPAWTTPDQTVMRWTAQMGAANAAAVSSLPIEVTARASSTSSADAAVVSGRAVGGTTVLRFQTCLNGGSADSGPLGVQAGAKLVVSIPATATFRDAEQGGTYDAAARTITWTFGTRADGGCATVQFRLRYPTSDPANVDGATKTLSGTWTGRKIGETQTLTLGTKTLSHSLIDPTAGASFIKSALAPRSDALTNTPTATFGEPFRYRLAGVNSGNSPWGPFTAHDTIPTQVKATEITANNPGSEPASVWVASRLGADGALGGGDDDQLVKVAELTGTESRSIDPYATFPNGVAALVSADQLTQVELRGAGGVEGDTGFDLLVISTAIQRTGRDGATVSLGDEFTNTGTFSYTSTVDDQVRNDVQTAKVKVDQPSPGIFTRHSGVTMAPGQREGDLELSMVPVVDDDMADPVFVVLLPAHMELVSWNATASTPNHPTPSLTKIAGWNAGGDTLLRWTYPTGTVAKKNGSYSIRYRVRLDDTVWTTRSMKGWTNSRNPNVSPVCHQNFFDGSPDADDKDGDGNRTEVLCPWFDSVQFATSSSAALVQSAKGSWDTDPVEAPGKSFTTPGSPDEYVLSLRSRATMNLDRAVVIDVLPRPGDTAVLSGAARNPATGTFPVYLRARPTVPTLASPVTTSYSTATNPCRTELSYAPAGCNAPAWTDWDSQAPSNLRDVTAVKFDYGTNVLTPGERWNVTLPVTAPASGASEADFAVKNPDPTDAASDEIAYNSSAFIVRRTDLNVNLLPSEAQKVGLAMPSIYGPPGTRAGTTDKTSSGTGTATQDVTVAVPANGSAKLLDGLTPVDELTVAGVGRYTIDPSTGRIEFQPVFGFHGVAPAVGYRSVDVWGQPAIASYTATVVPPAAPTAAPKDSVAVGGTPQSTTITVPRDGRVRLLDGLVPTDEIVVPGVGTYRVAPTTGVITFEPEAGYAGEPDPVTYVIEDAYGQTVTSTYAAKVTRPAPPAAEEKTSTGAQGAVQTITVRVPAGGRVELLDGSTAVTKLEVAGEGAYELDPSTGVVTFTPQVAFSGRASGVRYRVTDAYGQATVASYTPNAQAPAAPPVSAPTPEAQPPAQTAPAAAPAPAVCSKSRKFTMNWKAPKGISKLRWVLVRIDGRIVGKLRGSARSFPLQFSTTGPKVYRVQISAAGPGKVRYESNRDYRLCSPSEPFRPAGSLTLKKVR